jgi:outer membrane protein OmpA-like peptidoglycan-associated protein
MKKILGAFIVVCVTVAIAQAVDLKKASKTNVADTAEMKAANESLRGAQNKYGPILFLTGKAVIDVDKCKKTLNVVAGLVKKYPRFLITVEGHTDNVGNPKSNMTLSQKRAEAVVNWLVQSGGCNAKQLKAKGYGDTKPIADNKTDKGRGKNRRVDFQVSKL